MSDREKIIDFLKRVPSQYREDAMFRAYGRFKADHHRRVKVRDHNWHHRALTAPGGRSLITR